MRIAGKVCSTDCAAPAAVMTLVRKTFQSIFVRLRECSCMTATSSVRYARAAGDRVPLGAFGVLVSASPATRGDAHGDQRQSRAQGRRA